MRFFIAVVMEWIVPLNCVSAYFSLSPLFITLFVPQMQLAPVQLSELHSDLKIQEKDELQWKKLKAEGLDEAGEREAKLRRNFNSK